MARRRIDYEEEARLWRPGQRTINGIPVQPPPPRGMDPIRRLRITLLLLTLLVLVGMLGYHEIEGWSLLDSLFMTVITLSTVGYREVSPLGPAGKVFTIGLIAVGVTLGALLIRSALEVAVGQQFRNLMGRRRMEREIGRMENHQIVCGFGRMGQQIVREFRRRNVPHVVVEDNPEQIPRLQELGVPFISDDATEDLVLIRAGVKRARGLVAVASTDADNIFITLSARGLNPNLLIVARSIREEDEEKLRRAGADKVLSPYITGGRRMAAAVLNPAVVEFLDMAMHSENLELELGEVPIGECTPFAGKQIRECGIREQTGALVVAMKKHGQIFTTPSPETTIDRDDILVVIGNSAQLRKLQDLAACRVSKR